MAVVATSLSSDDIYLRSWTRMTQHLTSKDNGQSGVTDKTETTESDDWISFRVSGVHFESKKSNFSEHGGTLLGSLDENSEYYNSVKQAYVFDCNPYFFQSILDYYRTGQLHFPHSLCGPVIDRELAFWRIPVSDIAPCCWNSYGEYGDFQKTMTKFEKDFDVVDKFPDQGAAHNACIRALIRCRHALWFFFEDPNSSVPAALYAVFYMILILYSVASFAFETVPSFRVHANVSRLLDPNETNTKQILHDTTNPHMALEIAEITVASIFTIHLVVRAVVCPSKVRFFSSFFNWLDLVVVITQWATIIIFQDPFFYQNDHLRKAYSTFNVIKICRVLLLFKTGRQYNGVRILILSLEASLKELILLAVFMISGMIIFATLIYFTEFKVPDTFQDIPSACWWAIITMTTVGYGDAYPVTSLGYLVATICAVSGILILALPIPIIANNFSVFYNASLAKQRMDQREDKINILSSFGDFKKLSAFTGKLKDKLEKY